MNILYMSFAMRSFCCFVITFVTWITNSFMNILIMIMKTSFVENCLSHFAQTIWVPGNLVIVFVLSLTYIWFSMRTISFALLIIFSDFYWNSQLKNSVEEVIKFGNTSCFTVMWWCQVCSQNISKYRTRWWKYYFVSRN